MQDEACRRRLLEKANALPLQPGVYLMRDASGRIIYVGKSRKLKNRVSQYFRQGEKNLKTAKMAASVADFDYFLCDTEIEALTLENTLIKQHAPRYNIRLKDAKSYPYIKITDEPYPRLEFTRTRLSDKGRYFGPYSGASVAGTVLRTLQKTLQLPTCKRQFPRDIGKERPCLYWQLSQCCGVCTGGVSEADYRARVQDAADILRGNSAAVRRRVREQMQAAAAAEQFEKAAVLRDTLFALEKLSEKQRVVAAPDTAEDVFGFYRDARGGGVMSVFYIREGALMDKAQTVFAPDELLDEQETLTAFLFEHYRRHTDIPPRILYSFALSEENTALLSDALSKSAGKRVELRQPERGDLHTLCQLAVTNARELAEQEARENEKNDRVALRLAELLSLEVVPARIESYDISNFGSEHKTCGMIVMEDGKFKRADYRVFRIREVAGTDDYASMREALSRRFSHLSDEKGAFSVLPDLILLDGGRTHVATVRRLAEELGITVPIFGMVKDEYHKTRALCTDTEEISIALETGVFRMIYAIQEEVHRFSLRQMQGAKRSTLRTSSLEEIKGIGKETARAVLSAFGGLAAVKQADEAALLRVPGVGKKTAKIIYEHFHGKGGEEQ